MLYMEILFLKTKRKNYLKGSKRMILKCENLKKSYGDFCAIRKINYSFYAGSLWTSRTQWGWKIYMDEAF